MTETLQQEIEQRSREIHTDRYSMSVNEVVAMYGANELEVHPEFQRIFRWSPEQQSRLIESIFLGIPVPPIFVAQRQDGVWDVVDGVQRLSTVLRFMGELKTAEGEPDKAIPLTSGDYLKGLQGLVWDETAHHDQEAVANSSVHGLDAAQRRIFKRARLDFQIVQKESDEQAKFDLFQRLNSGTRLSEQEARNCLAVMLDPSFLQWLESLARRSSFDKTVDISERKEQEAYGLESALRYLACALTPMDDLLRMGDVGEFLTNRMRQYIADPKFDRKAEEERFNFVFDEIEKALGGEAFKRYYEDRDAFLGKFSISAFETITAGIARNVDAWKEASPEDRAGQIRSIAASIWSDDAFMNKSGGGKPANRRIPYMVEVGERLFKPIQ